MYKITNIDNIPKEIPIFPLSNCLLLPKGTISLNIFEPRYLNMTEDAISSNRLIGMIQPKTSKDNDITPELYDIGCMGKIINFKKNENNQFLIELRGLIRFKVITEINSDKKYRECEIDFENFYDDLNIKKENLQFSDLKLIFKDLKSLFEKRGFIINWKGLEKQSLDETINALAMASPFTLEEKQILLEAKNLELRKTKISEILTTYSFDNYNNTTIQ